MLDFIFYTIWGILIVGFVVPMTVYLCFRMGTLAILRAKQRFEQEQKDNDNETTEGKA